MQALCDYEYCCNYKAGWTTKKTGQKLCNTVQGFSFLQIKREKYKEWNASAKQMKYSWCWKIKEEMGVKETGNTKKSFSFLGGSNLP